MAEDYFVAMFFVPILICIGIFIVLSVIGKPASIEQQAFLGLGRVRLARGFLGAILATLVYATISAAKLGLDKVSRGEITHAELSQLFLGYVLYIFILTAPFVLAALIVIGLPILALLRKFNAMTMIWVALITAILSVASGVFTMISPHNLWCTNHLISCGTGSALNAVLLALPVAIGFALTARIPFKR